jgi:hypothetical protein
MRDVYGATFHIGQPRVAPSDEDLVRAAETTLGWMASKYGSDAPASWDEGRVSFGDDVGAWDLHHLEGRAARLWQLDWHRHDDAGMVWQTRCQVGASDGDLRFTVRIAIDSADDRLAPARYEVGRPAVIPRLAQSVGIHQDGRRLSPQPGIASAGGIPDLVDLLLDPTRRLPVVVLTPMGETGTGLVDAGNLAFRLIGLAHVVQVRERQATFGLTDRLGQLLSVFGGALRLYWPGLQLDSSPWDHPLWLVPRIEAVENSDAGVAKRLERQLAAVGVMRVRPDPLEAELREIKDADVLARLSRLQHELEGLLAAPQGPGEDWLAELQNAYDTVKGLEGQVTRLQRETEDLRRENDQMRRSFAVYSQAMDGEPSEPDVAIPNDATTSAEVVELARKHLKGLVIPDSASVALAELDAATEARAWARSAWRGLRALDAYTADAENYNGFWDWCERSGRSLVAASNRELALSESEFVMKSRELREKRRFAVDSQVDTSGAILMFAHLKVSEGGGQNIPRIYFHDDTKGVTGKIHIGFFGPHRFVPNKSTN